VHFRQGATLSSADFKAKVLPLHLNLTHTPPTILKEETVGEKDNEDAEANASATGNDAGFIGNLTLVPSVFSTRSYGWKGSKRLTIELQDGDTDAEGMKEKVQIMLTCVQNHVILDSWTDKTDIHFGSYSVNATVIGSKPKSSKGKAEEQEEVAEDAEHDDQEKE